MGLTKMLQRHAGLRPVTGRGMAMPDHAGNAAGRCETKCDGVTVAPVGKAVSVWWWAAALELEMVLTHKTGESGTW